MLAALPSLGAPSYASALGHAPAAPVSQEVRLVPAPLPCAHYLPRVRLVRGEGRGVSD